MSAARRGSELIAQRLLARAASRGERYYSIGRMLFVLTVYARFWLVNPQRDENTTGRALMASVATGVGVSFSLWIVRVTGRRLLSHAELSTSVVVDALASFSGLLSMVLYPFPGYRGLLATPDAAATIFVILSSVLRLYPRVVLISGASNIALTCLLLGLDSLRNGARALYPVNDASMHLVYLLASTVLALLLTWRTYALVLASAADTARAQAARRSLKLVLEDHHDARSLISAIRLNAEQLVGLDARPRESQLGAAVLSDLSKLSQSIATLRDRAHAQLDLTESLHATDARDAVLAACRIAQQRYPQLELRTLVPTHACEVEALVGAASLERTLLALIANAVEGDSGRGARHLELLVKPSERTGYLEIRCSDDGPGFPARLLEGQARMPSPSDKPGSGGLGLWLAKEAVEAAGGRLTLANRETGAVVSLELHQR